MDNLNSHFLRKYRQSLKLVHFWQVHTFKSIKVHCTVHTHAHTLYATVHTVMSEEHNTFLVIVVISMLQASAKFLSKASSSSTSVHKEMQDFGVSRTQCPVLVCCQQVHCWSATNLQTTICCHGAKGCAGLQLIPCPISATFQSTKEKKKSLQKQLQQAILLVLQAFKEPGSDLCRGHAHSTTSSANAAIYALQQVGLVWKNCVPCSCTRMSIGAFMVNMYCTHCSVYTMCTLPYGCAHTTRDV